MTMFKGIMKLFRLSMLSIEQASSWRFVGLALIALIAISLPHMTEAEEESKVVDALTSPEQMAKSLDSALASQRAELADLKILQRQLETLQDAVQTEIKAYDSQDAAHGQLLLMSKLRIEDLENAIKDNRLASRALAERVDSFQKRLDSTSILFQKTTDRIEMAQNQIADIRQSQLSDAQKQQLRHCHSRTASGSQGKETARRALFENLRRPAGPDQVRPGFQKGDRRKNDGPTENPEKGVAF